MAMKNEISRLVGANMLLEKSRETAPEGMKRWSRSENKERLWLWQVMEIKSDAVKDNMLQQSQVGRSMTQGKSEVVKQEMGRVNFYILGVSGLKQTGMGAFFFNWFSFKDIFFTKSYYFLSNINLNKTWRS